MVFVCRPSPSKSVVCYALSCPRLSHFCLFDSSFFLSVALPCCGRLCLGNVVWMRCGTPEHHPSFYLSIDRYMHTYVHWFLRLPIDLGPKRTHGCLPLYDQERIISILQSYTNIKQQNVINVNIAVLYSAPYNRSATFRSTQYSIRYLDVTFVYLLLFKLEH